MHVAIVDIPEVHLVNSRDMFGNPKIDQSDIYSVTISNDLNAAVVVNTVVTSPVTSIY